VRQAPVIPVAFGRNKFLISPHVKGWHPTLLDQHPLTGVTLAPSKGD
jgi:oligopeptide transport system substrate-binding protein